MNDRAWLAGVTLLALAITAWVLFGPSAEPPPDAPETVEAATPKPPARPRTRQHTYHLPRPDIAEEDLPALRASKPDAPPMSTPDRAAFNRATHQAKKAAHVGCLGDWIQTQPAGTHAEMVMNARVVDGEVIDIELRSLVELPGELLDCIRDAAWEQDWPSTNAEGDFRFQVTLEATSP